MLSLSIHFIYSDIRLILGIWSTAGKAHAKQRENTGMPSNSRTRTHTPKRGAHECTLTRNKSVPLSQCNTERSAASHLRTAPPKTCAQIQYRILAPHFILVLLRVANLGYIIVFPRAVFSIDFVGVSVGVNDYMICGGLRFECIRMCVL